MELFDKPIQQSLQMELFDKTIQPNQQLELLARFQVSLCLSFVSPFIIVLYSPRSRPRSY